MTAFEKVYGTSHQEEKAQVLKELRALLLTYPPEREKAREYILNAIWFIEQE
jgi:hypothetical protein